MSTTTDAKKKSLSPFAKKESLSETAILEKPTVWLESKTSRKPKWQATKQEAEEDVPSDLEEDGQDQDEDSEEPSDVEMDELPLDAESLELAVASIKKEFTQLRSIMFALICWEMSRTSASKGKPSSISLQSLQEAQQLVEMVAKYLSDTSKWC